MVWKASIHSGLSYPTSPLIVLSTNASGSPRTLRDHGQQPHDEQRVEGDVTGAVDERRHAERRQWLHHRLEVGDRPRRLETRSIEQRLVVVQARGLDATAQGERKGPRGASLQDRRDGNDRGTRASTSAILGSAPRSASRPSRAHARTNRPSIITSPTGSPDSNAARASRSHSGPRPGSARMSHSMAGCWALKSS